MVEFCDASLRKRISTIENQWVSLIAKTNHILPASEECLLRWAFSFSRITQVGVSTGNKLSFVPIDAALEGYRRKLFKILAPFLGLNDAIELHRLQEVLNEIALILRQERSDILKLFSNSFGAEQLDAATRSRPFALALGGGGGAAYVYVGAFAELDDAGIAVSGMGATSMGAILGAYRARESRFDVNYLRGLVAPLSWRHLLQKNRDQYRFGLPAAFRLYLREVIGHEFEHNERFMKIKDLPIPVRITVGGVGDFSQTGEPKISPELFEGDTVNYSAVGTRLAGTIKQFMRQPLKAIYLGADEMTAECDLLDAMGFSCAVPGLIHYDISRDDPEMEKLFSKIAKAAGVSRFIDGGLVDNLPSNQAALSVQEDLTNIQKDPFVFAMDCFAPNFRRHLLFLPLMKLAERTGSIGCAQADGFIRFKNIISPMSVVPTPEELMATIDAGRKETKPHIRYIRKMCGPIPEPTQIFV